MSTFTDNIDLIVKGIEDLGNYAAKEIVEARRLAASGGSDASGLRVRVSELELEIGRMVTNAATSAAEIARLKGELDEATLLVQAKELALEEAGGKQAASEAKIEDLERQLEENLTDIESLKAVKAALELEMTNTTAKLEDCVQKANSAVTSATGSTVPIVRGAGSGGAGSGGAGSDRTPGSKEDAAKEAAEAAAAAQKLTFARATVNDSDYEKYLVNKDKAGFNLAGLAGTGADLSKADKTRKTFYTTRRNALLAHFQDSKNQTEFETKGINAQAEIKFLESLGDSTTYSDTKAHQMYTRYGNKKDNAESGQVQQNAGGMQSLGGIHISDGEVL